MTEKEREFADRIVSLSSKEELQKIIHYQNFYQKPENLLKED